MAKTITLKEMKPRYTAAIKQVKSTGKSSVIEQDGKPFAVVIPYAEYQELAELRESQRKRTWHAEQLDILHQENAAYKRMKSDLLKTHKDKFVAIHNGAVVDSDTDEAHLSERIYSKFGERTILITQVTETPRVYHVNSTQLSRR